MARCQQQVSTNNCGRADYVSALGIEADYEPQRDTLKLALSLMILERFMKL